MRATLMDLIALVVVAVAAALVTTPCDALARPTFAPCPSTPRTGFEGINNPAPPSCEFLGQRPWCDARGKTVGCCAEGLTWSSGGCVCAPPRHLDEGRCCGAGEHWTATSDSAITVGGLCCPSGMTPTRAFGGGHSDGGPIPTVYTCCPVGTVVEGGRCLEPMPCLAGRQVSTPIDRWLACETRAVRSAASATLHAAVIVGPIRARPDAALPAIRRAIETRRAALLNCYSISLKTAPTSAGLLAAQLTVDPRGVATALFVSDDTTKLPSLAPCVVEALRSARWPATAGQLSIALAFQHPRQAPPRP